MKCSKCGESVKDGDMFCHHCGNQVRGTTEKKPDITFAIISVVLGGLSFLFGALFFPISIIGLILGICQKEKTPLKTVGIVLNSIGLFISIIAFTLFISFIINVKNNVVENKKVQDFVEDIIEDNIDFDEDKFDALDDEDIESLLDKYSYLTEGSTAKEKDITGTWVYLNEKPYYLEFKDGVVYKYDGIIYTYDKKEPDKKAIGTYKEVNFTELNDSFKKVFDFINKGEFKKEGQLIEFVPYGPEEKSEYFVWAIDDDNDKVISALRINISNIDEGFNSYFAKMAD